MCVCEDVCVCVCVYVVIVDKWNYHGLYPKGILHQLAQTFEVITLFLAATGQPDTA